MTFRDGLAGGAALGVVLAIASGAAAETKPTHKRHPVQKAVAAAPSEATVALQNEMSELRAQVEALKAWKDTQTASQAQADAQMAQLKAQLADAESRAQAAQARVDAQIETIPGTVQTAVKAATPKTDKLYYKGVSITLGGFAAMETVLRSHDEGADIGSTFSGLPFPDASTYHTQEARFSARQSRLSLLAQGDVSDAIHLAGYGEFDFLGSAVTANSNESNSYTPRVRHLYSTVDWDTSFGGLQLLAGQTWSLVTMNAQGITPRNEVIPLTIDAQYVPGFDWARQPQMRLTANFNKTLWFAVSVENPQATFYNSGNFLSGVKLVDNIPGGAEFPSQAGIGYTLSLNKVPDVIAKVALEETLAGHMVHLEGYGIYRDFYDRLTNTAGVVGNTDTAGGGVGGGLVVGVIPHLLDLQASGLVGRGVGRYGSGQLPDVTFGVDGTLHPIQEAMFLGGGVLHLGSALDVYVYGGEERESQQAYSSGTIYNGLGNPNYNNTGCDTEGDTSACVGNSHFIDQIAAGFWDKPYIGKFGKFQWGIQYSYTERHLFPGYGPEGSVGNPDPVARENMILTSIRYYPF